MKQQELFLQADAALREVIDQLTPDHLAMPVPSGWSTREAPTLRDILAAHTYDEAWIPDLVAGRTIEAVGDAFAGDLLGENPIASYDRVNDAATAVMSGEIAPDTVVHFTYGDYPIDEALEHITWYRAFQTPLIAALVGIDCSLPETLVEGLFEQVTPQLELMRSIGVFPPEVTAPSGANRQTQLLCLVGYFTP